MSENQKQTIIDIKSMVPLVICFLYTVVAIL